MNNEHSHRSGLAYAIITGLLSQKALTELKYSSSFNCLCSKVTEEQLVELKALPEEFDWRNVGGRDYVSPVRYQGTCGSCFAFSTLGMFEARVRILSNGTKTPVFSTQDVVSCSEYSQGCEGGIS